MPPSLPPIAPVRAVRTFVGVTTIEEDFKTLRRYSRQEVAAILKVKDSWLKEWVWKRVVPHQRSGEPGPHQRGVWFTYDDILATGALMPSLMSGRQANSRAEVPVTTTEPTEGEHAEEPAALVVQAIIGDVADDELARYRELASLRRL